jgi:hypothetical protein
VLSQDIPPSDPIDQDEEETWDTVGPAAERNVSLSPANGEAVPESAQQGTGVINPQTSAEERRQDPHQMQRWSSRMKPRKRRSDQGGWHS